MKNKILTIVLTGGLLFASLGWVSSHNETTNLSETVKEQKLDVDKKSTEIANLDSIIVKKDEKIQANELVIGQLEKQSLNKDKQLKNKDIEIKRKDTYKKKLESELSTVKTKLEIEKNKKKVVQNSSDKISNKDVTEKAIASRGKTSNRKTISAVATSYIAMCNTGCTGVTATGLNVKSTGSDRIIAVDPRVIPLHSKVKVTLQNGRSFYARAEDTGGDIKGGRIDILKATYGEAVAFGRQTVTVTILE